MTTKQKLQASIVIRKKIAEINKIISKKQKSAPAQKTSKLITLKELEEIFDK